MLQSDNFCKTRRNKMNAVKVQYTVKESYVETNKQNISKVTAALKELNNPDIKYIAFLLDDGKTFVHFAMRANEEAANILANLEAFQQFQQQLKASQPEIPPQVENLNMVASGWDIF
jgi:hypothetical protein